MCKVVTEKMLTDQQIEQEYPGNTVTGKGKRRGSRTSIQKQKTINAMATLSFTKTEKV